ncbi:MaoC family dehydratase [Defluviicoccus vanus]|uniref:MaoC family dehydratase n=1 Tax=Defluviicoccus vanus TaxID=111831 RepID=A0A7H1N2D3_9PROT|nr:MaoC family dehydratase [Defluviicoccus vanus]QNT69869.1 MaoC family dehydratase [Defluviicoccus vanus]
MAPSYADINVGDEPIRLETDPISRTTLALYCGASGDHNPMHIDIDYAKAAGEKDVFAHGMLVMAYLGRSVTSWVPQTALRSFNTRFTAITRIGEKIICTGKVVEKKEVDGEKRVKVELLATNEKGESKAAGEAVVALS